MKKILKKEVIIAFIVGIILASSIAVYAYNCAAKDVSYIKPGTDTAISVETALNDLYSKTTTTLLWTNNNPTSNFGAQTIEINLSDYKYVIIITGSGSNIENKQPSSIGILKVENSAPTNKPSIAANGTSSIRECYAISTGVVFEDSTNNSSITNNRVIPMYIYGVKNELGI